MNARSRLLSPLLVGRILTGALVVAALLTNIGPAAAAPVATDAADARAAGGRHFGFGATVGFWSGAGAIVGGGGDAVKAWLSGGYSPVMVFANARTADRALRFNYYHAYQINGDLALRLAARPRLELALLLGYKFNDVLGHGGGLGAGVNYELGPRLGLVIAAGLALFPSAKDRLVRDQGYPDDRAPSLSPALQGGANVGLIFFP